jgi:cytochrome c oxidase assembly protein subunit 15
MKKNKLLWSGFNLLMIVIMVIIGGVTRLTDSGLSMTNWNLLLGVIPPLNEADWISLFDLYKQYPEYQIKNYSMTLNEFKKIFFWEYLHRMWGRLIGLTFFIPLIYFFIRGAFNRNEKKLFIAITLLGFFQAFMGWYMVQSGLIEQPDVSHFRLSAHLLTAFIIYSLLLYYFWMIFTDNDFNNVKTNIPRINNHKKNFYISLLLLLLTISAGAWVSGTEAGLSYNNFPYMGDGFLPPILSSENDYSVQSLFYDQGFLQFSHRLLATFTLLFILHTIFQANKDNFFLSFKTLFYFLFGTIIFQYTLGILILKLYVPTMLALVHQLGSLIILTLIVISICESKKRAF